jgi:hypothetical protein
VFFKGSRYEKVAEDELIDDTGRIVRFKKVRLIPETRPQGAHRLQQHERLDHVAHRYYQDAERFWRICDANRAMWPDDLAAEPGTLILIPSAED